MHGAVLVVLRRAFGSCLQAIIPHVELLRACDVELGIIVAVNALHGSV